MRVSKDQNGSVFINANGREYLCEPSERAIRKFLPETDPSRGWIFVFIMILGDGLAVQHYGLNKIFQLMESWILADDVWHALDNNITGIHPTYDKRYIRRSAIVERNPASK